MPLSSQMHTPKLMGEDDKHLKYGCDPEQYAEEGHETKEVDGVLVTMAKRKADGTLGVLSCEFKKPAYDSEKAGAWLAAQSFSLEPADLHSVKDVEIFSTGLWNGKQITETDLEAIVEAFTATRGTVAPYLKLGHDDDQKLLQGDGLPAAGWVENVRKVGSKLVADFVDIPRKIFQLIKNKAYRKVSCEIYNNIDIAGAKYPKMLGAVALLGSDLPGVLNLNDILSLYSTRQRHASVQNFAADGAIDILSSDPITDIEDKMPQEDKDNFKAELDQAKTQLAAKDAEIEKFKKEAEDAKKLVLDAAQKAKAAEVDAFVTALQADNLCSKSMAPLVKALLNEDKEKYAIDGADLTKADLFKKVLSLAKEGAKVNFTETTKDETAADGPSKDLNAKIEKYAADHKVSYRDAYKAVTKDLDLDAKPMHQEERAGADA